LRLFTKNAFIEPLIFGFSDFLNFLLILQLFT
jgi:hypothetical protein